MKAGNTQQRIWFVGIKGIAMAALAVYYKEKGCHIGGSDTEEEFPSDTVLKNVGIRVVKDFDPGHIDAFSPDLVVYTGAHGGRDNSEVRYAQEKGISVFPHGKALGDVMSAYRQISVAGCHGKTTTSGMVATILTLAGKDPSYAIGSGEIRGLGLPGHNGRGEYFIGEADEYVTDPGADRTPRFLWQSPEILAVTNIDFDHPDVYATLDDVKKAYILFRNKLHKAGALVINADDENSNVLDWSGSTVLRVGRTRWSDFCISHIVFHEGKSTFRVTVKNKETAELSLVVPGLHNIINAAISAAAARFIGLSWDHIKRGLLRFRGAARRFEFLGENHGVIFYDDYAHHPREIQATLAGARQWYPTNRIITVFQPHTFSRTKVLLSEFASSFSESNIAIFSNIYASAREQHVSGMSGDLLADKARGFHKNSLYAATPTDVKNLLEKIERPGDIIIFMGAGDIYSWGRKIAHEEV